MSNRRVRVLTEFVGIDKQSRVLTNLIRSMNAYNRSTSRSRREIRRFTTEGSAGMRMLSKQAMIAKKSIHSLTIVRDRMYKASGGYGGMAVASGAYMAGRHLIDLDKNLVSIIKTTGLEENYGSLNETKRAIIKSMEGIEGNTRGIGFNELGGIYTVAGQMGFSNLSDIEDFASNLLKLKSTTDGMIGSEDDFRAFARVLRLTKMTLSSDVNYLAAAFNHLGNTMEFTESELLAQMTELAPIFTNFQKSVSSASDEARRFAMMQVSLSGVLIAGGRKPEAGRSGMMEFVELLDKFQAGKLDEKQAKILSALYKGNLLNDIKTDPARAFIGTLSGLRDVITNELGANSTEPSRFGGSFNFADAQGNTLEKQISAMSVLGSFDINNQRARLAMMALINDIDRLQVKYKELQNEAKLKKDFENEFKMSQETLERYFKEILIKFNKWFNNFLSSDGAKELKTLLKFIANNMSRIIKLSIALAGTYFGINVLILSYKVLSFSLKATELSYFLFNGILGRSIMKGRKAVLVNRALALSFMRLGRAIKLALMSPLTLILAIVVGVELIVRALDKLSSSGTDKAYEKFKKGEDLSFIDKVSSLSQFVLGAKTGGNSDTTYTKSSVMSLSLIDEAMEDISNFFKNTSDKVFGSTERGLININIESSTPDTSLKINGDAKSLGMHTILFNKPRK